MSPAPAGVSVRTGYVQGGGTVVGAIHGNVTIVSGRESEVRRSKRRFGSMSHPDDRRRQRGVHRRRRGQAARIAAAVEPDLDHVQSADGAVFRTSEEEDVRYRVEVTGAGFTVEPEFHVF